MQLTIVQHDMSKGWSDVNIAETRCIVCVPPSYTDNEDVSNDGAGSRNDRVCPDIVNTANE